MQPADSPDSIQPQPRSRGISWVKMLLVAAITIAILAPFSGKAFHIDDPVSLWAARQIRSHPLDFYGFDVDWYWTWAPMYEELKSPPLVPYVLAIASLAVGWSEVGMHLSVMVFAVVGACGIYVLASRMCTRPLAATLAAILTPAYLVCSNSVMLDVPMVCLWIWAVVLWDTGLRKRHAMAFVASAVLIAACALSKYFGASLIPLLLVYSAVFRRGIGWWALAMLIPLGLLGAFELWTHKLYGRGLIFEAAVYSDQYQAATQGPSLVSKTTIGLAFAGGCAVTALFFMHRMLSRTALLAAACAVVAMTIALACFRNWNGLRFVDDRGIHWSPVVQTSVLLTAGAVVLMIAVMDVIRRRDAASILLSLWVAGTFLFATFLNWSVTARTILPMVPAVGILIVRRIEDRGESSSSIRWWSMAWPLGCTVLVSLAVLWGDYSLADTARTAARRIGETSRPIYATLWFQGHWGFQYYLQELGGKPLDFEHPNLQVGDRLAMPGTNSNVQELPRQMLREDYRFELQPVGWIATMNPATGAGFHSSAFGPLPYAFGPTQPEVYRVYIIASPIRDSRSLSGR